MENTLTKYDIFIPPPSPKLEGLVLRGFQGETDYPHILAMINASKQADQVQRSDSVEDVRRVYTHLTNCDPYKDMIFAEIDGEVIGYGRVAWSINSAGEWLGFHLAYIHPNWRHLGLGTTFLRHNEARLREIASELISANKMAPSIPGFYEVFALDTEKDRIKLFTEENYKPVRYGFEMIRSFAEPILVTPMPEGLEVRKINPDQYRMVWDAAQEAFQDHWGNVDPSEQDYQSWLEEDIFDPDIWQVAWDGDQIAGMVLDFINLKENEEYQRKRGYTETICVRRPWRRQGLARALLTRSLQAFKEMGMDEAALGVDTQNVTGALDLYKGVGFTVSKCSTQFRKPL
jgi:mycothiol synthase